MQTHLWTSTCVHIFLYRDPESIHTAGTTSQCIYTAGASEHGSIKVRCFRARILGNALLCSIANKTRYNRTLCLRCHLRKPCRLLPSWTGYNKFTGFVCVCSERFHNLKMKKYIYIYIYTGRSFLIRGTGASPRHLVTTSHF